MTNICVLVLDTLRDDFYREHFDGVPGTYFSSAYSTANWTVPAHASLFTGRYATEAGVHAKAPSLDVPFPVLAERLAEAGYHTRCWTTNPNVSRARNWDRGFDRFRGRNQFLYPNDMDVLDWDEFAQRYKDAGPTKYLRAVWESVVGDYDTYRSVRVGLQRLTGSQRLVKEVPDEGGQEVLRRLEGTEFYDDEFLFVNLMETHTPYAPPEQYDTLGEPLNVVIADAFADTVAEPDKLREAYENEVRYLREVYQRILDELQETFDYIITLSDHGEMLGEHGMWNHGYGVYPELAKVPLSVVGPEFGSSTDDKLVNLLDVFETILSIAGIDTTGEHHSLLSEEARDLALVEFHGLLNSHHDQLERKGVEPSRITSIDAPLRGLALGTEYYGFQTHDKGFMEVGTSPTDGPEELLDDEVDSLPRREVERDADRAVSDDVKQQLRDLGYA